MSFWKAKISVLPPTAKTSQHPLYNESEIIFECRNCTLTDGIQEGLNHEAFKTFCEKNHIQDILYIYYEDVHGNWQYYNKAV